MAFNTGLLHHANAIHSCLPLFEAESHLDIKTMKLRVEARNRYFTLLPQFLFAQPRMQYSPTMQIPKSSASNIAGLHGFIGWLPYFNKRWPEATDKLRFKQFCHQHQLPIPRFGRGPFPTDHDFIVKTPRSSFGAGIHGPFRCNEPASKPEPLRHNEYWELFIRGKIAKAWYWNDKLACLELLDMPKLKADGKRSLGELVCPSITDMRGDDQKMKEIAEVLRYQGISLDTVPPHGATFMVDIRYASALAATESTANANVLASIQDGKVARKFMDAGAVFWRSIPEEIRAGTIYSVDAIVDCNQEVWFLEMNCNPALHPDVYPAMFEDLFGPPREAREATPLPPMRDTSPLFANPVPVNPMTSSIPLAVVSR